MIMNLFSTSRVFVLLSFLFLFAFESWMTCDDIFGVDNVEEGYSGLLRNGDPALVDAVMNGKVFVQRNSPQTSEDSNVAKNDDKSKFISAPDTNNVAAVIIMGAPSLPDDMMSNALKERLLHGVRTALLAGSPWIIIPQGGAGRRSAEEFLWELKSPSEALFPEAVVSELPSEVQKLAIQMRDSMSFDTSLKSWIRRGRIVKSLSCSSSSFCVNSAEKTHVVEEDMSSPRLLRYGASEWILPGFLWSYDVEDPDAVEVATDAERSVKSLQKRFIQLQTERRNEKEEKEGNRTHISPSPEERGCFDVIVVSSMHNEWYARAIVYRTMRQEWKISSSSSSDQKQSLTEQREAQKQKAFSECIHVFVTSAADTEPEWDVPSPLFVSSPIQSQTEVIPPPSALARYLGAYAHTIHANYKRWFAFFQVNILAYRPFSLINEMYTILLAHLTETLSLRDFAYVALNRPKGG